MMRRAILLALVLAGCVRDPNVICDDLACPEGSTCTAVGCALPEQLEACATLADDAVCQTPSFPLGSCSSGVCLEVSCGDGRMIGPEVCDDRNQRSGDGCSADCLSSEVCGNNYVDTLIGEQCDSGVYGLSGDGCTSNCLVEIPTWSEHTYAPPSPRRSALMTWDTRRDRAVLFGGEFAESGHFDETWELEQSTWIKMHPLQHPVARTIQVIGFDPMRNQTVLLEADVIPEVVETWLWDGIDWQLAPTAAAPPARGLAMAFDPERGVMVLVAQLPTGGISTWTWDGSTWTLHDTPVSPPDTSSATAAWDPTRQRILVVVGYSETWSWDGVAWEKLAVTIPPALQFTSKAQLVSLTNGVFLSDGGNAWSFVGGAWSRSPAAAVLADVALAGDGRGTAWLFGGYSPCQSTLCQESLSGATFAYAGGWWGVSPVGPRLAAPAIAFDVGQSRAIAFGGGYRIDLNQSDQTDEMYESSGDGWKELSPPHRPSPRFAAHATSTKDGVLLYGGQTDDGPLTDFWRYADGDWSSLPTIDPPLFAYTLAGAPDSSMALVRGDRGGTTEIWFWDGATWTIANDGAREMPVDGPLVYDVARSQFVAYDGTDTWTWAGQWSKASPPVSPTPRQNGTLVYDALRKRVVLIGGLGASNPAEDTWEWDGQTWTRIDSPTPTPQGLDAGYFDPRSGTVVVLDATTRYTLAFTSALAPRDACIDRDTDADGLVGCADPDCELRCTTCGDGTCDPLEDRRLCPADCP